MRDEFGPFDVANIVDDGVQGNVVQAHTVHGGVHVHHHPARSAVTLPCRFGVVPPRAGYFQRRSAFETLMRPFENANSAGTVPISAGRVRVLSGLGGVGKTQLAVDYAERLWSTGEIELLVWVTAGSVDAIVSGYARTAAALTGVDDPDPKDSAQRFLEWLAGTAVRWLVVLDDLESPADLSGLWPPVTHLGLVVVTTRRTDAALRGHGGQLIKVDEFTPREGRSYFETALADQPELLDDEADALALDLGHLPLALAQSAAYLRDRSLTCARYRVRMADRRRSLASLFPEREGLPDQHRTTVAATWSLSIEHADRLQPEGIARPLLEIVSVLDANGIPADVFTVSAVLDLLGARTEQIVDEESAQDGLRCLQRMNLITWDSGPTLRVHALVQRAVRESLSADQTETVTIAAAQALVQIWPAVERDTAIGRDLRANTAALTVAADELLWASGCHPVLFRAGRSLGEAGSVTAARTYFTALHSTAIQHLAPSHPDTLTVRANLARWRGMAGDPVGAAAAFEDLLVDRVRVLGPDCPDTLHTRANLARWRGMAGDLAGAAAAFEDLLVDRLRVLGPDHPDTLNTRNNLAHWRGRAGDPVGAAAAYEGVLADQLRVLTFDHPDTLNTRADLARWRGEAGDPAGAVAAFEGVFADRVRVLGSDHPNTLNTRANLARWRGEAGDLVGAVAAFEGVLADRVRVLGPDHPDTLNTRASLAYWMGKAGDPVGAIAAFEGVLADRVRVLGPDHPNTLNTRANLARWQGEAGDPVGAVAEYEGVLADRVRVLGPEHPDTLNTRANLTYWRDATKS